MRSVFFFKNWSFIFFTEFNLILYRIFRKTNKYLQLHAVNHPFAYYIKYFFFNHRQFLLHSKFFFPLRFSSSFFSFFRQIRLWFYFFSSYSIIGFELWGLGLNLFLLNSRTKLGKKYKDKKKKKKISFTSKITITLRKKLKILKKKILKKNFFFFYFFCSKLKKKYNNYQFNFAKLNQKFSFKIGLSHRVGFFEPSFLRAVEQRKLSDFRRKRFFFLSNNLFKLKHWSSIIRYLKGINIYKFRGMKFLREDIELKIGKIGRI